MRINLPGLAQRDQTALLPRHDTALETARTLATAAADVVDAAVNAE